MRFLTGIIFLLLFAGSVFSIGDSTTVAISDTLHADTLHTDTLHEARLYIDTTRHEDNGKRLDSLATTKVTAETISPKEGGPVLIKRTYDFKSQVRVGIAMMIFIGVIFFTAQSLNP
jgi:hypothetical protein